MTAITVLVAVLLGAPIGMLLVECLAALWPPRRATRGDDARPRADVLMCAHNEEDSIGETLANLQSELRPGDRVVVVADNCDDATAEIARQHGAVVVERRDPDRRGKGYALSFGLDRLEDDHASIIVVFDADCRFVPGGLDRVVSTSHATGRPVQAAYRMAPAENLTGFNVVSHFAVLVKNIVRLRGMTRLGMPALITGSGTAYPWGAIRALPLAQNSVAEDTLLSVDLALHGDGGRFREDAEVFGSLPSRLAGAKSQRKRWEHGHMTVALQSIPRLLVAAVLQGRPSLAFLALDLAIPPLSLLGAIWTLVALLGLVLGAAGFGWGPAAASAATGLMLLVAVAVAWRCAKVKASALSTLLSIPFYVLSKIPIYVAFVFRRQRIYTRTERDESFSAAALPGQGIASPGRTEVVGE
jgi:cellulose synthase/poly-beta-1,6-N-acetylglucosamine synthase-like glycosyltransferase